MQHIKHTIGAVLFWLLLITASCEPPAANRPTPVAATSNPTPCR